MPQKDIPSTSSRFSSMRMMKHKSESEQLRSGTERKEPSKLSKAAVKKPRQIKAVKK